MLNKEDVENEELLKLFGLAVINAQALEVQVVTLFAASELIGLTTASNISIRELMDTRFEQTLGRLIKDAMRKLALDASLSQLLTAALFERNWLVHHFYREFAPAAFDSRLRQQAMQRLKESQRLLEKSSDVVYEEVIRRFIVVSGCSRSEIEERSKLAIEGYIKEKGKEN